MMTIADDWTTISVQALASKARHSFIDGDWIEAPYITDDGIRLIQTGNIGLGEFIDKNKRYISENAFNELNCKEVVPGDILICRLADPIGRSCIVPTMQEKCITSVDVCILRVDQEKYNTQYIAYVLNQACFLDACQEVSAGSTRQRISRTNLGKIEIDIATNKQEQTQIAAILATIDKAIAQTAAIIAKQQRIKTGLMQDLLTRGIDEHGAIRSEATHAFKDSPLGRIPVEWKAGGILDFASKNRQAILTGPFGSNLGAEDFVEEGIPILRIGNVQAGYIDLSDLLFVSEEKAKSLNRYVVQAGDLLFARQGATTGRNSLAGASEAGFLFNYHIIRVAVDPTKCSPTFLYAAFNSERVQNQVNQEKGKGTREGVSTATLTAFTLPIPPFEEQSRIASILDAQNNIVIQEKRLLAKLKAQKQGLMQDLLTGKVRVTALLKSGPHE